MRKKFTFEEKLSAVIRYLDTNDSFGIIAHSLKTDKKSIRLWVALYQKHGENALRTRRCTNYPATFKMDVLKFIHDTEKSIFQTAVHFNIPSPYTVTVWKNAYEKNGVDAFVNDKKERPLMSKKTNKTQAPQEKTELQRLVEENEQLRMENDYLKKLNALVQEKRKLQIKTERKQSMN